MSLSRPLRCLPAALIISALTGCDNVEWGGIDVALRTPPPRDTLPAAPESEGPAFTRPLPEGPLLYLVERDAAGTSIRPLAEITDSGLAALAVQSDSAWWKTVFSLETPASAEFNVYADGTRVGRFISGGGPELGPAYCAAGPAVPGRLEVVPEAVGVTRFLALSQDAGDGLPETPFSPTAPQSADAATTRSVMGSLIPSLGLNWPPDLDAARASLDVLDLGESNPAVAATFLFRDQFSVGPAPEGAYALFFLAISTGPQGYRADFVRHEPAGPSGKQIPAYVSHLDWDGDGEIEVLLEILGGDSRWFAAVESMDGEWATTFEPSCGAG